MACIDTYNSDQPQYKGVPIGARISFSNDFVDPNHSAKQDVTRSPRSEAAAAAAAASADFEFFSLSSASPLAPAAGFSMMSADELFFKGRLLPLKDAIFQKVAVTTLRDELLMNEDEDDDSVSVKPQKGSSTRWKGFLGLKKTSHTASKRSVETISDEKFVEFEFNSDKSDLASDDHKTITPGKASPDVTNHGGSDRGDTETVL